MIEGLEKVTDAVDRIVDNIEKSAEDEIGSIDEVIIICAVHYGSTEDGAGDIGSVFYACSTGRGFIQRGLLEDARRAVDENITKRDDYERD